MYCIRIWIFIWNPTNIRNSIIVFDSPIKHPMKKSATTYRTEAFTSNILFAC